MDNGSVESANHSTATESGVLPGDVVTDRWFEALLESAPDAIVIVDADGRIAVVNQQTEELFGYQRQELVGQPVEVLVPERFRQRHVLVRTGYVANPKARPMGSGLQLVARRKDGTEVPIEVALSTLREQNGLVAISTVRDVTERRQAEAERERYLARRDALLRVARHLAAETDSEVVLTQLLEEAVSVLGGDGGVVHRWDPERGGLIAMRSTLATVAPATFVPLGQGAVGQAAERLQPVIVNDYQQASGMTPEAATGGVQAAVAVVLLQDGRLMGALEVVTFTPGKHFAAEDAEVLEILASIATTVLVKLEHTDRLRELAELDPLTGLANRQKAVHIFPNLLDLARRHGVPSTVAMLDLDHFKQVNDHHGHSAGDLALRHLAALLRSSFRGGDVVARWGGEEFLVGLYGCNRQGAVERLTQTLSTLRADALTGRDGETFQITFSGGVAEYPTDGTCFPSLIDAADRALYVAKAQGRARIVLADCTTG